MKKGTIVRMSEEFKQRMLLGESKEHIEEFGECIGVVEDKCYPDLDCAPEVNVRWEPSKLRYGYFPKDLKVV